MLNSRILDYRFWVTLILSCALGIALIMGVPILASKPPLYLIAFPVGFLFFTILVIKPKWFAVVLFLSRPLLDNLLNLSKIDVAAKEGVGIGAVLNLAIIVLVIFLTFYSGNFPSRNRVTRSWFVFLFLMFIVLLYSPFKIGAMRLYFNYLSYFAMFLLPFLVIKNKEDFLFWLKILALSFILPVLYAYVDLKRGGHYFPDAGIRISGTFSHPNILAFYLVLGLTVYFYILKSKYWKLKLSTIWGMRILMLGMLVLLIATKTRNAWVACLAIFFIYGLLKDKKMLLTLFCLIPLMFAIPPVKERILTVISNKQVTEYQGINSLEWRLRMWKSCLPLIAERPLQGYGMTSFRPMSEQFSTVGENGAHNVYLELLFDTGIFGVLSFIALFLSPLIIFLKNMFKSTSQSQAKLWAIVVAYVISYMLVCSADNMLYYLALNWYVWFFIGLMLVSEKFSHE